MWWKEQSAKADASRKAAAAAQASMGGPSICSQCGGASPLGCQRPPPQLALPELPLARLRDVDTPPDECESRAAKLRRFSGICSEYPRAVARV